MSHHDWARVKGIVSGALTRTDLDRAAYLAAECGDDGLLRAEVQSLVAAAIRASGFYEDPTLLVGGRLLTIDALADLAILPPGIGAAGHVERQAPPADRFEGTERYAVCRRIGAGGMGIVYEVHDRARDQRVALKTLQRWQPEDIYRLKREFRNLAGIAHPNLATLYDLIVNEGQCFFTMELVDGISFVEHVRARGTADIECVRRTLPQLVEGVRELHRRGVFHRDIKPSNVLVTRQDTVVILDFGLASTRVDAALDERGLLGTPAYMAPERCAGRDAGEAGGWYSVGATLYQSLTGRVPFEGTLAYVIDRKLTEDPAPVASLAPEVPHDLAALCAVLLSRDPAARLAAIEALLRAHQDDRSTVFSVNPPAVPTFVGRQQQLAALADAFDAARNGECRSVYVHGPSGIGKTSLVQEFFDRHLRNERCVALRSRCHEHESVPYKGLDGIVDGLSRHLAGLPHEDIVRLMPADAAALARLFPVMQAAASGSPAAADIADPVILRRRAFDALRELIRQMADRTPLVIEIDDFHWADADSAAFLAAFLKPPVPPSLLLVLSFRSEEIDARPFLRTLVERADMWTAISLQLAPLSDAEIAQLTSLLAPPGTGVSESARRKIREESNGNPFLVEELARSMAAGDGGARLATLDETLARRIDMLPAASRAFLETLAVCGRPMLSARVAEATGLSGDERPLVARLQAAHFLRRSRSPDHVEIYHERIREALARSVSSGAARRVHERMAAILVAHGDDDPESLFEHYRAAGQVESAALQSAAAAARAGDVLAFDRAAEFFGRALELRPDSDQRLQWMAERAAALENAGRPAQAADAYLAAASETTDRRRIEWQRKAAELLLMSGHIDRGLAIIETVLPVVGMRLPGGPRSALASIALRRARLAWRGLDFEPCDQAAIAPGTLLRIDTCWAIATGLMLVDTLRASSVQLRQLLMALDAGEPYRVARALALEACLSAAGGGESGIARSAAFAERASAVAQEVRHPHAMGLASLTAGVAAFVLGDWTKATALCERALTILRDECTGVVWELTLAHNFYLGSLFYRGQIRRVSHWLPGLLEAARERGNLYFETELTTRFNMVWLAADDPDGGERLALETNARWSASGFHRQHYNHLHARTQAALYRGRTSDAWSLASEQLASVRRNWWLRVQLMRIETAFLRARCALAMASEGRDVPRMMRAAAGDAERLTREGTASSLPQALLVRATMAHLEGNERRAIAELTRAAEAFRAADMQLYGAVTRRRLGILLGGDRGRELRRDAEAWMAGEEIRNPAAMSRLLAPGLPER